MSGNFQYYSSHRHGIAGNCRKFSFTWKAGIVHKVVYTKLGNSELKNNEGNIGQLILHVEVHSAGGQNIGPIFACKISITWKNKTT